MKTLKIGLALIAVIVLASPVTFAQEEDGKESNERHLQMLMEENDTMMQVMHGMMDHFKEMDPKGKGTQEMEAMMQEMAQMRMNHRMNMMMQENGKMMALMHKIMGHLKEMEGDEHGDQAMEMMMNRMERLRKHHQEMMDR